RAVLAAMGSDYSTEAEALRSLLDEAERIRLELLALDDLRERLRGVADAAALVGRITSVLAATGDVLAALADGIATRQPPAGITAALQRIEQEARALRHPDREDVGGAQRLWVAEGLAHVEALAGELRAAVEIATQESPGGEEAAARVEARRPLWLRFHQPIAVLRANLTLRSTACRHALRLAVCLGIASALARSLDVSHTYWIPLTAAIILKPDFGATLKFSIGRAVGTLLGLGVSTVLIVTVLGHVWGRILLIGVFVFFVRSIGRANYGLLVLGVTAFVVLFTSFAGARPESTILERGIDTLVGGALALLIYVLWPTWERSRVSAVLADLLEAYRRYFRAVMAGYLDPRQANPAEMSEARQAARLARTNAEASVDRLRGEPARSTEQLDRAVSLLASSHRFARSAMAFEAARHEGVHSSAPDTLYSFAGDVDTTLHELSRSLRDPSYRARKLPDLRADQQALAEALSETLPQEGTIHLAGYGTAIIAGEADRMTDSVNTMAQALMRADR
ncbi:MAG TPA: FUSC family protein, partial [Chloroflexota bacterium]|nr:FUSC family protein [Chloroflexota bacterium]